MAAAKKVRIRIPNERTRTVSAGGKIWVEFDLIPEDIQEIEDKIEELIFREVTKGIS